jgi:FKBP-type peptidyl-prolyl cis-trans isomerase 2
LVSNSPRAGLTAVTVVLTLAVAGCLGGDQTPDPVTISLISDAEISAQPGWTVGWAVNVGQTVGDNQSAALTVNPPPGWVARYLKPTLDINTSGKNATSFLLVEIPADAADGSYEVKANAQVGDRTVTATGKVEVRRPTTNVLSNGTAVTMDYVGFLEDNRVFDTSMWSVAHMGLDKWPDFANSSATRVQLDYNPLSLTLGTGQVIKGWEIGLLNMSLGQSKALIIPPDLAYGRFLDQEVNTTEVKDVYTRTTVSAFTIDYGEAPAVDGQYKQPVYGWTVRVVDVDNVTQDVVLENLPGAGGNYTPYGVNATVLNLSSANGTFEVRYAPVAGQEATNLLDTGNVVAVNASNFTIRWQTEHRQPLAPYTLYFLVYVRTAS